MVTKYLFVFFSLCLASMNGFSSSKFEDCLREQPLVADSHPKINDSPDLGFGSVNKCRYIAGYGDDTSDCALNCTLNAIRIYWGCAMECVLHSDSVHVECITIKCVGATVAYDIPCLNACEEKQEPNTNAVLNTTTDLP